VYVRREFHCLFLHTNYATYTATLNRAGGNTSAIILESKAAENIILIHDVGQWRSQDSALGAGVPLPPLSPCPPLPLPSLPLEVGPPRYSYRVWGSTVSSPSGVWGRAPAEIDFSAF